MEKRTIGAFIAALRKANGLTQKQLAEKLCVSDKAVSRWERDECAPDLTLIPVIAEIFGITTDELLRGERKPAEQPSTQYEIQKTDKQLRRLLQQTKTTFRIRSILSFAIAFAGLIAALICNNGFLRAGIGFFCGCVFYAAAAVCQIIFLILAFSAVQTEEFEPEHISPFKKECILLCEAVFAWIVLLFAATLPLAQVSDAYAGLTPYWWLQDIVPYTLTALILCAAICFVLNARLGYQRLPDTKKPLNRLRLRFLLVMATVLFASFLAHGFTHNYLYTQMHIYAPGSRFDTWEELKEFLETPLSAEGEEMLLVDSYTSTFMDHSVTAYEYQAPDGTIYHTSSEPRVLVYDGETPKYEYIQRNFSIREFSYSMTEDSLPIYTYNYEQQIRAENALALINLCICVIYPIELAIGIVIYRNKRKALL